MNLYKIILFFTLSFLSIVDGWAYLPGSVHTENSIRRIDDYRATTAYSIYIGPNAAITIEGEWHIYSKRIWISPLARIEGNGKIVFHNPGEANDLAENGYTEIDGNNDATINVNIEHRNDEGLVIMPITLPSEFIQQGWTDNILHSSVKVGKQFDFAVDGANVWLGMTPGFIGNFVFDALAFPVNFSPSRMVITSNSIQSHMVKINGSKDGFTFPVGINAGDYTPAIIKSAQTYYVSVIDFSHGYPEIETPEEGMDRIWHIYGGNKNSASVTLVHNSITNGSKYNDAAAFITQYEGNGKWSTANSSDYVSEGLHTNLSLPIAYSGAIDESWLTKTSDDDTPLPVELLTFTAKKINEDTGALLQWETKQESNNKGFEVERSQDGKKWETLGFVSSQAASGNSHTPLSYSFIDEDPLIGNNQYRLKQFDLDGSSKYTHIVSLHFSLNRSITVVPNPANNFIRLIGIEGNEHLVITNIIGQVVKSRKLEEADPTIQIEDLAAGSYNVRIYSNKDELLSSVKLIVVK